MCLRVHISYIITYACLRMKVLIHDKAASMTYTLAARNVNTYIYIYAHIYIYIYIAVFDVFV